MSPVTESRFTGPAVASERDAGRGRAASADWQVFHPPYARVYHLVLHREENGFSAYCLELPGAVSEGDTEEEAIHGLQEAIEALLEEYGAMGKPVPWEARDLEESDEIVSVITVE